MKLLKFIMVLVAAATIFTATESKAVQFLSPIVYIDPVTKEESNWLAIHGHLEIGDARKIIELYEQIPDAKGMWISGPGGYLTDALVLTDYIYKNKVKIVVPPRNICASACALMAYSSPDRTMYISSRIGLHRAFEMVVNQDGELMKDSNGNPIGNESEESKSINMILAVRMEKWGAPMMVIVKWLTTNPLKGERMFWIDAPANIRNDLGFKVRLEPETKVVKKLELAAKKD